jgi:hypothetical protein
MPMKGSIVPKLTFQVMPQLYLLHILKRGKLVSDAVAAVKRNLGIYNSTLDPTNPKPMNSLVKYLMRYVPFPETIFILR